ncbi:MAG TPA: ABC transporter ATP-binding protein [Devosia sp.]|jgi:ABC-2 type transport system ATP-binding protein|nr:ABC transporter ATP-binding protein [Devosia sp.]
MAQTTDAVRTPSGLPSAIEIRHLRKRYGTFEAVRDISFSLSPGEVLGFLGPNGAGKSTTMKMIAGYVPVTSGVISLMGQDIQLEPVAARRSIGYLPEGSPLYGEMTVADFLGFVATVRGLRGQRRRESIATVVAALELEVMLHQRIETLSKGFKRRVGLAQAVLHDPAVMILDEPTDGLDPNQKFQVRNLIRSMGRDKAIIISTHLLEEVDAVCDRVVVIDRGQIVFMGTPAELRTRAGNHNAVRIRVASADKDRALALVKAVAADSPVEVTDADGEAAIEVRPSDKRSLAVPLSAALGEAGVNVVELRVKTGSLDDVFRTLTTRPMAVAS